MTNDKCPKCGAEYRQTLVGVVIYECGRSVHPDGCAIDAPDCVKNRMAKIKDELDDWKSSFGSPELKDAQQTWIDTVENEALLEHQKELTEDEIDDLSTQLAAVTKELAHANGLLDEIEEWDSRRTSDAGDFFELLEILSKRTEGGE